MKWVMAVDSHLHRCSFGSGLVNLAGSCCLVVLKQPSSASEKKNDIVKLDSSSPRTPPKIDIESENDGLEEDFPFPGVYSQVPY